MALDRFIDAGVFKIEPLGMVTVPVNVGLAIGAPPRLAREVEALSTSSRLF